MQSTAVSHARLCSIYTRLSHMLRKALAYLMLALQHPSQRSPNGSQFASLVLYSHCRTHTDHASFCYNYSVLDRVAYQNFRGLFLWILCTFPEKGDLLETIEKKVAVNTLHKISPTYIRPITPVKQKTFQFCCPGPPPPTTPVLSRTSNQGHPPPLPAPLLYSAVPLFTGDRSCLFTRLALIDPKFATLTHRWQSAQIH